MNSTTRPLRKRNHSTTFLSPLSLQKVGRSPPPLSRLPYRFTCSGIPPHPSLSSHLTNHHPALLLVSSPHLPPSWRVMSTFSSSHTPASSPKLYLSSWQPCLFHTTPLTHCLMLCPCTLSAPLTASFVHAACLSATPPLSPAHHFTVLALSPLHTTRRNHPPLLVRRPTPSLLNPPFWVFLFYSIQSRHFLIPAPFA